LQINLCALGEEQHLQEKNPIGKSFKRELHSFQDKITEGLGELFKKKNKTFATQWNHQ
jgi:hypothetical protein